MNLVWAYLKSQWFVQKVKSFLCTSLRSGGIVPHILTATLPRESPPVLTEQEAGWGPEPVCRSWRREKMSVGNEMIIAIEDPTNNSPSIWQPVYLHMIKRAAIELHCDNMRHYYFSSGLHMLQKFSLPYWQEFEQQQHLRVIFKWKVRHITWILFCHWLPLIFLADQDQLLALNVWSRSWHQM